MKLKQALVVLNNHLLCLSGKMVGKPKQKEVLEALQIVLDNNKECDHIFNAVPRRKGESHNPASDFVAECVKCSYRP